MMNNALERKMDDLQKKMRARCKSDGTPRPGYEQNVARIKAEMELISGRIEIARAAEKHNGRK